MQASGIEEQYQQAQNFLEQGKCKAALKRLTPLYQSQPHNIDIILATVDALVALERGAKARSLLLYSLKREPREPRLWGALAHSYWDEDDQASAHKALDKAQVVLPNQFDLMLQRAGFYAACEDREALQQQFDAAIAAHPDAEVALLRHRAEALISMAYGADDNEAQVKDGLGMVFAVVPLQAALNDLTRVIERDEDWHHYFKRADVHKKLQNYDDAIADFDAALKRLPDTEIDLREHIQQERDGCLNNGRNERERLAQNMRESLTQVDAKGVSLEDHMANNMVRAVANQHAQGGDILALLEEVGDDPQEQMAFNVAQEIVANATEAPADYTSVDPTEFPKAARQYNARVGTKLADLGFHALGDFEPRGLRQQMGRAVLVSIFVSEDHTVAAACYRVTPLRPAWWLWLIQCLLGQYKSSEVVEFESVTDEGNYIITNNTAQINVFSAPIKGVDLLAMESKAGLAEVLRVHNTRLAGCQLLSLGDTEALFAEQERLRQIKVEHRQSIGYVTEEELKKLLGKHYDGLAERVKKYLNLLSSQSV